MTDFSAIDRFHQYNRQSHLDQLFELLRIASISADCTKKAEMTQAANGVGAKLAPGGLKTKRIHGDGPPLDGLNASNLAFLVLEGRHAVAKGNCPYSASRPTSAL